LSLFLENYKSEMLGILRSQYPELSDVELGRRMDSIIKEKMEVPQTELFNSYKMVTVDMNLLEVTDLILKNNPILSGYGVLFSQHRSKKSKNLPAEMLKFLLSERKKVKKEMFTYVNSDPEKYKLLDTIQKIYKLLANSYYGASGEKSSIFYDRDMGASVTFSGVQIITTSVMAFEAFLSNNIDFNDVGEALLFVSRVLSEEKPSEDVIDEDKSVNLDELVAYLVGKIKERGRTTEDEALIRRTVEGLSTESMNRIYYKNNLLKFFENEAIQEILDTVMAYVHEFPNAEKPPEDIKEELDRLWNLSRQYVMHDYIPVDRYERALNDKRKSVLVVDTDSNFLNINPFYEWVTERYDMEMDTDTRIGIVNIMINLLSRFVQLALNRLTENCNIDEDHQPIINMKNEFLYSRLMITSNKKSYAGSIIAQEGNRIDPPKLDIKGLAIKKVTVNKYVRDYFTKILKEDIVSDKKINLSDILKKYKSLEETIKEDIAKGNLNFSVPNNLNEVSSYAYPYRMMQVRGAEIWNELFPNDLIVPPTKVNILKLKAKKITDLKPIYGTEEFEIIKETIFDNPELADYGFTVIAMPKEIEELPEWLVQFVDVDQIVSDNIANAIILLESLGSKTMNVLQTDYYSNVVEF
jgi:DNA polymerase elongation subunit (family B)